MKTIKDLILQRFNYGVLSMSIPKFVKEHYPGAVAVRRQGCMTKREHEAKWAIICHPNFPSSISKPAETQSAAWESAALRILQGK